MKKILFFIGIICAGIIATWSCSSDEKSITEEPQEGTFSLELGMNLQDLGSSTKALPVRCLTEVELFGRQTNNDSGDDVEAVIKLKRVKTGSPELIKDYVVKMRGATIGNQQRLVTEVLEVPYLDGATYTIEQMMVRTVVGQQMLYASVLLNSPAYLANPGIQGCVTGNSTPIEPIKFGKVTHNLCLHCIQNYIPEDFGLSILLPNYFKHYCINFIVDLCSDVQSGNNNPDVLGVGTYEIYRTVLPASLDPKPSSDTHWNKIATGRFGKDVAGNPVLGKICFYDDPTIDDKREWYSIRLTGFDPPLNGYMIETVPVCPNPPSNNYVRGVPLSKMLALLTTDGHALGGLINEGKVVHFWWCRPIAGQCAPNEYKWPKNPITDDFYNWYDTIEEK